MDAQLGRCVAACGQSERMVAAHIVQAGLCVCACSNVFVRLCIVDALHSSRVTGVNAKDVPMLRFLYARARSTARSLVCHPDDFLPIYGQQFAAQALLASIVGRYELMARGNRLLRVARRRSGANSKPAEASSILLAIVARAAARATSACTQKSGKGTMVNQTIYAAWSTAYPRRRAQSNRFSPECRAILFTSESRLPTVDTR